MEQDTQKKWYFKWWAWCIYAVVLVTLVSSVSGTENGGVVKVAEPNKAVAEQPVEAIKATAIQISADYKENEVAADAKYKNKTVEISGSVDTIGKDILDTPYIAFQTASQYEILDRVQCMFSKSDEAELAAVTKGQKITLRGEVSGKLGNIIVKDCEVVK